MTKAQEKALKTIKEFVHNKLKRQLAQKKNDVLFATGEWAVRQVEARLEKIKSGEIVPNGWTVEKAIEDLENKLQKRTSISFEAMKEGEISYDLKVERMADKIVSKGMGTRFLKIENATNENYDMEFLVTGENVDTKEPMAVHSRVIFVHGSIQAPHYRFITTVRK
ncbi:MAG: hypothetical protein ACRBG0_19185 [Lewinella sp.]|uniref:hypothetical protein n=1 Tax=Lewinella sp. TaxID=2004506 RepID=UPI003D6B5E54